MRKFLIVALACSAIFASDFDEGVKAYERADYGEAFSKFSLACQGNETQACEQLAVMYHTGKSVQKDTQKAFELYVKACDGKSKYACSMAGGMKNVGEGVKKDIDGAIELLQKACELGEGHACSVVGAFYLDRQGAGDFKKAKDFFDISCKSGDELGCWWAQDIANSKRL